MGHGQGRVRHPQEPETRAHPRGRRDAGYSYGVYLLDARRGSVFPGKVQLSEEQEARLDALRDPRRGVAASLAAHERIIASDTYDWAAT